MRVVTRYPGLTPLAINFRPVGAHLTLTTASTGSLAFDDQRVARIPARRDTDTYPNEVEPMAESVADKCRCYPVGEWVEHSLYPYALERFTLSVPWRFTPSPNGATVNSRGREGRFHQMR